MVGRNVQPWAPTDEEEHVQVRYCWEVPGREVDAAVWIGADLLTLRECQTVLAQTSHRMREIRHRNVMVSFIPSHIFLSLNPVAG